MGCNGPGAFILNICKMGRAFFFGTMETGTPLDFGIALQPALMKFFTRGLLLLGALSGAALADEHVLSTGKTSDGRIAVAGVDATRSVRMTVEGAANGASWSVWFDQGLDGQVTTSAPSLVTGRGGGLVVLARNGKNEVTVKRPAGGKKAKGEWADEWAVVGGADGAQLAQGAPFGVQMADGSIAVFVRGPDNRLYWNTVGEDATQSDGKWRAVSPHAFVGTPSVARSSSGDLQLFVRGADNLIYHATYAVSKAAWTEFKPDLSMHATGDPVVATNSDGRVEVFATGQDGALHHKWQVDLLNVDSFAPWKSMGGVITSDVVAVAPTWDGRLTVFARGSDNGMWTKEFSWDAGWGQWTSLGGVWVGSPAVANMADGRQALFAVAKDLSVWTRIQSPIPNAEWLDWAAMNGEVL